MKSIYLLTLLFVLGFIEQVNAHSEVVARLVIEPIENGLAITASFEKRNLTYALQQEADCTPKDMLNICANQYIRAHIQFLINGKQTKLKKVSQQLTKNSLLISYQITYEKSIEKLTVKSDYMFQYNDHAKVKVISKLSKDNLSYNLSVRRKTINVLL